jgi:hypothetical protein
MLFRIMLLRALVALLAVRRRLLMQVFTMALAPIAETDQSLNNSNPGPFE